MGQFNPFSVPRAVRLERNKKNRKDGEKYGEAEKFGMGLDRT